MKKRRYSLVQRVLIKLNALLYTSVGRMADVCKRIGIAGEFSYSVEGHYGDAIDVSLPYPVNFQSADEHWFGGWKIYVTFPHDFYCAKEVSLTSDGIVLRKHLTFIKTLPHPIFRYKYGILYNLKSRLVYKSVKSDHSKKYLLLFDNWSWNNYFHWIIDALCRAELIRTNVREEFTVVLPKSSPAYLTETLKLYGYTDFEYLPERSMMKLDAVYAMNYAAWSGQQHPDVLQSMVDYVISKLGIENAVPSKRIYISRSKQFSRRVANEQALVDVLEKYGFEIHHFEGMPFAQQVALMQSATHFVTSHGANMTNLIFLPRGAKVFELLTNHKPNFCYWSVASNLKFDYYYQLCEVESADHLQIDIATLENNLRLFLSVDTRKE